MGRRGMMKSMVVVVMMVMLMKGTAAERLTVGDEDGWKVPSSPDFYPSWAAKQTCAVGDTLVFKFSGTHTVSVVTSKEAFDKCDPSLDKNPFVSSGNPAEVPLKVEGELFFFCAIGSHCANGQKFAITVGNTGSGPTLGPTGSQAQSLASAPQSPPPQSPPLGKGSAPKPVVLTLATLSLFLGAFVLPFGNL